LLNIAGRHSNINNEYIETEMTANNGSMARLTFPPKGIHPVEIAWVVIGNSNSSTGQGSVIAVDEVKFTGW
jgi:hypothetical protein